MKGLLPLLLSIVVCAAPAFSLEKATITSVSGTAEVRTKGSDQWQAAQPGTAVVVGSRIETRPRSRVKLTMADGSKMELFPNSRLDIKALKRSSSFDLALGRVKAWVTKNVNRAKFEVRTPVAVCSVRGTEFSVAVDEKGGTGIEVWEGLVGVRRADGSGEDVPVGAGEKLDVTADRPLSPDQKRELLFAPSDIRREVGLAMSKEEVQAAAADEMRLAEYREGKTMIDVNGNRVRLEEYVMRPAPDTFKLVVLNERSDRFDYFYYRGKFNADLPDDLSIALGELGGKLGDAAPAYWLTEYEQGFSNTRDYVKDTAAGGHLVKVTYNNDGTFTLTDAADPSHTRTVNALDANSGAYDPLHDVFVAGNSPLDLRVYDPRTDAYENFTAGQTFWRTGYNSYEHVINGARKLDYVPLDGTRNILAADLDGRWVYPGLDTAGNTIYGDWGADTVSSWPDGTGLLHQRITTTYRDGTFERYDTWIISDEGKVASAGELGGGFSSGAFKSELLQWNYEQSISASEFEGRTIDLVVEPRILIRSGLLQ